MINVDITKKRRFKSDPTPQPEPKHTFKEGITINYNITNVRSFCSDLEKCGGIVYLNPDLNNILEV